MRRNWLVTALCLVLLGLLSAQAYAEVRVVVDRRSGEYRATRVLLGERGGVWSAVRRGSGRMTLNVHGDEIGDSFPAIGENTVAPHHPWAVWSRYHEFQYDLAWSRWSGVRWEPIRWVGAVGNAPGDDFDPDLVFDSIGRPYVAWWRLDHGVGRIYLSTYLSGTWMEAFPVSASGLNSRYPTVEVLEGGTLVVRYHTPDGPVEQNVVFDLPVTITEDINPLDFVFNEGNAEPILD